VFRLLLERNFSSPTRGTKRKRGGYLKALVSVHLKIQQKKRDGKKEKMQRKSHGNIGSLKVLFEKKKRGRRSKQHHRKWGASLSEAGGGKGLPKR